MGFIGNAFNSAVDAAMGNTKKPATNLETFLTKFSSPEANWIDTLDPLCTFDVQIKFYPSPSEELINNGANSADDKKQLSLLDRANAFGNSLVNSAKQGVSNLVNNMTGGLLKSYLQGKDHTFEKLKTAHKAEYENKNSFAGYVAKYNYLVGSENWLIEDVNPQQIDPLEIELGLYTQSVVIPHIQIPMNDKATTYFGDFSYPSGFVVPDKQILTMTILNTKAALHERLFYPWLRETSLPYWVYKSRPYTIATITIDFTKHNSCRYIFTGCRPVKVYTMQPNQSVDSSEVTRNVDFQFDFMYIDSDLAINDSITDKLVGTGKTLLNAGMTMFSR